jgi:hypothetical protein
MLPAPASIAAPPSPKSKVSCVPAVPPPPVTGAAVGNRLADEVGVADRLGVTDRLADGLGVAELPAVAVAVGKADGLVEAPVVTLGAAPGAVLGTLVDVAEPVTEGENIGVDEDGLDVQPETAAEPSMVKVPKPMAVSLVLSAVPAMVVRTFIQPPHAPTRFPRSRHCKPVSEAKTRGRPVCQSADDHKGNAQDRRRHAMARSRLEY